VIFPLALVWRNLGPVLSVQLFCLLTCTHVFFSTHLTPWTAAGRFLLCIFLSVGYTFVSVRRAVIFPPPTTTHTTPVPRLVFFFCAAFLPENPPAASANRHLVFCTFFSAKKIDFYPIKVFDLFTGQLGPELFPFWHRLNGHLPPLGIQFL